MRAVRPHSIKGIILCHIIQFLCLPLFIIKGKKWLRARVFEENPRTMGFKDIVYFAYKYYFKLFKKIKSTEPNVILNERVRLPNYRKARILLTSIIRLNLNRL